MKQNRLSRETSPYLLQHRSNPVDWWPWGAEALAEAQRSGKPILLSVGYAACHWCHVMAHESFEDEATAQTMNAHFINIKVDREERPDIDAIYMTALQHLGQRGGWPLTMFLTPQGEPFWGGTYFPKTGGHGRPAFSEVLGNVARIFRDEPGNVDRNRSVLMQRLKHVARPLGRETLGLEDLDRLAFALLDMMDDVNGGLKGAPKFPQATPLEFLWRAGQRTGDPRFLHTVDRTLTQICRGGIYDHIGGGFSRYAVDEKWLVPHFEKMLYDNAQLLELVALAYRRTQSSIFLDCARDTVAWLAREMTTPENVFCASLDADSEGVEGGYYVWSAQDVAAVLGEADAAFFSSVYDVTPGGNFEGKTIINALNAVSVSKDERARLARMRAALLAARDARTPPARDDKVLADWNGMTIAALVHAGIALDEPAWIERADIAFRKIASLMTRSGRLGHSWRLGRLMFPGLASDHVAMTRAALALYEVRGDAFYLEKALEWQFALDRHHADPDRGGYFLTADDAADVVVRLRPVVDDALPNINAVAAQNLLNLAFFTDRDDLKTKADRLFDDVLPAVKDVPLRSCALLNALDTRLRSAQIVVTGEGRQADELNAASLSLPYFARAVLRVSNPDRLPASHSAREKSRSLKQPAAFVCVGEQCSLPLSSVKDLIESHASQAAR